MRVGNTQDMKIPKFGIFIRKLKMYRIQITFLLIVMTALFYGCKQPEEKQAPFENSASTEITVEEVQKSPEPALDKNLLLGEWIRTDSACLLKISGLPSEGLIQAEYFGPDSILLGEVECQDYSGIPGVSFFLMDEKYPGSYYILIYDPDKDMLEGAHFQAEEKELYYVDFIRKDNLRREP